MNAQLKAEPKPTASLAQLECEQAELEQLLIRAERDKNQARTDLAAAICESDAEAIKAARAEMRRTAADIAEIGTDLTAARERVHRAQARAHVLAQANSMEVIERLAGEMVKSSEALEQATMRWALTWKAAVAAATEYETQLSRNSVSFDAFLSVANGINARLELLFWLESDGKYGRCRSLDTPSQLRESRRASLVLAAKDFRTLTLRHARGLLGIPEAPNG